MSENQFEPDVEDAEESDTMGPSFDQVDAEIQDNLNADIVVPEIEEDDE